MPASRTAPSLTSTSPSPRGDQLLAPPGEQPLDFVGARRDAQLRVDRGLWPVDLVEWALDDTAGEVVQSDLVSQLEELEVHRQRGSTRGGWCRSGSCCRPIPPTPGPARSQPAHRSRSRRARPRLPGLDAPAGRGPQPEPNPRLLGFIQSENHHPINGSVSMNDARSWGGFAQGHAHNGWPRRHKGRRTRLPD